ncbi:ankyrin repeat-containing domain protein [Cladorrhinum sp. PSN332]|nr:ankyrin repeat-containing domain protein [Cladorrhinum sp. PSN332]
MGEIASELVFRRLRVFDESICDDALRQTEGSPDRARRELAPVVRFIHEDAKEYFRRRRASLFPLILSSLLGISAVVHHLLLQLDPNVDDNVNTETSSLGMTALHYAVRNQHLVVVDILLSHGADPCIPAREEGTSSSSCSFDGNNNTPLHSLARSPGAFKTGLVAGSLVEWCADVVYARNREEGKTALMVAAWHGTLEVVRFLVVGRSGSGSGFGSGSGSEIRRGRNAGGGVVGQVVEGQAEGAGAEARAGAGEGEGEAKGEADLDRGITNARDASGLTALHWAVLAGDPAVDGHGRTWKYEIRWVGQRWNMPGGVGTGL